MYKPKHFVNSKITLQTKQKSKQEIEQQQFIHQLAKQNTDKNRERQAKYYNKNKKKDPWKDTMKVKFRYGKQILPIGDYCLKNLGKSPNKQGTYEIGDATNTKIIDIDADYIVPAAITDTIIDVIPEEIEEFKNQYATYSSYKRKIANYIKDICYNLQDEEM